MSDVTLGTGRQETMWFHSVKIDGQINERLEVVRFQSGGYKLIVDGDWKNAYSGDTLQDITKVLTNMVRLMVVGPVSVSTGGSHPRASEFSLTHGGIR